MAQVGGVKEASSAGVTSSVLSLVGRAGKKLGGGAVSRRVGKKKGMDYWFSKILPL